jgi:hypothetical protein
MRICYLLLLLCCCTYSVMAQQTTTNIDSLVNAKVQVLLKNKLDSLQKAQQPPKPPTKPHPAFTYQFTGNGQVNYGNVDRVIFSSVNRLQWKPTNKIYKINLDASYVYGEKSKVTAENDLLVNLNNSFWYEKRWYAIVFGTYEYSNLRGIRQRYLAGGGIGWQAVNPSAEQSKGKWFVPYLSLTNAIIYETTDFYQFRDIEVVRNSLRVLANFSLFRGKMFFNNTIFLQQSLMNENFRSTWSAVLRLPISPKLSFQTTFDHSYESLVPANRLNADIRWLFGFMIGNM